MPSEKAARDSAKCQIFTMPNTLKKKVGFTTHLANQAMVARAEEAVSDIKVYHAGWLNDDVGTLVEALRNFQSNTTERTLACLYRASHDVRGQALLFDYPLISRIAHLLCDLIETFADVKNPPFALMSLHVEAIRALLRDRVKEADNRLALEMIQELERKDQMTIAIDKAGSFARML